MFAKMNKLYTQTDWLNHEMKTFFDSNTPRTFVFNATYLRIVLQMNISYVAYSIVRGYFYDFNSVSTTQMMIHVLDFNSMRTALCK